MNKDDLTHNSFEEQWQKAFDDASMTPPEALWDKIELGLEQNAPPKSDNRFYYLGGIVTAILGVAWWFSTQKSEIEKPLPVVETQKVNSNIENKPLLIETLPKPENIKPIPSKIAKKQYSVALPDEPIEENVPAEIQEEVVEKTLSDSVSFIAPIPLKPIKAEFTTVTPELTTEQTPYYEKPTPKPKKKSILKNIKISGGIGVYQ
jgi:hypothetical protein